MEKRVGVELRIEDGVEKRVTTKALTIAMMHNYFQDSVGTEELYLARFHDFFFIETTHTCMIIGPPPYCVRPGVFHELNISTIIDHFVVDRMHSLDRS